MGRQAENTWPGHELPAVAVPVQPRLIEQAQSLAVAAIREDVPVDEVTRDLERLSHEALVADQPVLAATVAAAQAALERAEDAFDESAAREQLALAMNDFVVTASDPVSLEAIHGYRACDAGRRFAQVVEQLERARGRRRDARDLP